MQPNDRRLRHAIAVKLVNPSRAGYTNGYLFSRVMLQGKVHSDRPDPEGWFFYPYPHHGKGLSFLQYESSMTSPWDSEQGNGFWCCDAGWEGRVVALAEVEYVSVGLSELVEQPQLPRPHTRRRGRRHKMRLPEVPYGE